MSGQVTQGYPSSKVKATILENKVVAEVTPSSVNILNPIKQNYVNSILSFISDTQLSFPLFKWVYNPGYSTNSIVLTSGSQSDTIDYNLLPTFDSLTQTGHGTVSANITPQSLNFKTISQIQYDCVVSVDLTLFVYENIQVTLNWSNLQNRSVSLQIVNVDQYGDILSIIFSSDQLNGTNNLLLQKNLYYRFLMDYSSTNNNLQSTLDINLYGIHNIGSFSIPIPSIKKITESNNFITI
jgi:hypothetical protein